MAQTFKELFAQAKPIACGNTWGTLSGDEQKRMCLDCNRNVHNLAELTPQEFNRIQAEGGERMCVVYEKRPGFWPIFAKPFAAIFTLLMLAQPAVAEEQKEHLMECQTMLYTPMIWPPATRCLDECGQPIERGEWFKKHPDIKFEGAGPDDMLECKDKKPKAEKPAAKPKPAKTSDK